VKVLVSSENIGIEDMVTVKSIISSHNMGLNSKGLYKIIAIILDKKGDGNFSEFGSTDYVPDLGFKIRKLNTDF
jgi:hypothetical protein